MSSGYIFRGEDAKWSDGYGREYDTFVVFANDDDIATYQVHADGALERLWSRGPVAMTTPIAVASRESAVRQCRKAWESSPHT